MTDFSKVSKRLYPNNPTQTKCSVGTQDEQYMRLELRSNHEHL